MKEFWNKYKGAILKLLMILVACIFVSFLALLILYIFKIVYFNHGIRINASVFNDFQDNWYGILLSILFYIFVNSSLSFVPGKSMALTILYQAVFNSPWKAFLIVFTGIELSSIIMYLVGRYGGYNICKKILGEKDCERASKLLNNRGVIYFPLMMIFPLFPDDALVMLAGTFKMKLKWFIPSIIIGRGVGAATVIFGIKIIPFDKFTSFWHWLLFIIGFLLFIVLVFYLAHLLNKYLDEQRKKTENPNIEEEKNSLN